MSRLCSVLLLLTFYAAGIAGHVSAQQPEPHFTYLSSDLRLGLQAKSETIYMDPVFGAQTYIDHRELEPAARDGYTNYGTHTLSTVFNVQALEGVKAHSDGTVTANLDEHGWSLSAFAATVLTNLRTDLTIENGYFYSGNAYAQLDADILFTTDLTGTYRIESVGNVASSAAGNASGQAGFGGVGPGFGNLTATPSRGFFQDSYFGGQLVYLHAGQNYSAHFGGGGGAAFTSIQLDYTISGGGNGSTSMFFWNLRGADFNNDQFINGQDVSTWATGFGAVNASIDSGDGTGDHIVDGADILMWQRMLEAPATPMAAIPEPTSLAMASLLVLAIARRR